MPPAFALSQDQTLRFIHPPQPRKAAADPTRDRSPKTHPSSPSKPSPVNHQATDPARQHPPARALTPASSAARASHSPSADRDTRHTRKAHHPAIPKPKGSAEQRSPLIVLPKPDANFNQQRNPAADQETEASVSIGQRPYRVGNRRLIRRGAEVSGSHHQRQGLVSETPGQSGEAYSFLPGSH
jgi:hypothetical protein